MEQQVSGPDSADGDLIIMVVRGKNLPNRRKMDKQKPYVTLRIGTVAKRTEAIFRGGQRPEWKQQVRFELHRDRRPIMKIDVLDETEGDPTPIGNCEIDCAVVFQSLDNFKDGKYIYDKDYELKCNGYFAGSIYLEMTFYPAAPVLPPKINSASANDSHSHKLVSEDFPRPSHSQYEESMYTSTSSAPQVAIDERTFYNRGSGRSSQSPERHFDYSSSDMRESGGSGRPSLFKDSGLTNGTISTAATSTTSDRIYNLGPFDVDESPKKKGFSKILKYFKPPPQNYDSVWDDAPGKKSKHKFFNLTPAGASASNSSNFNMSGMSEHLPSQPSSPGRAHDNGNDSIEDIDYPAPPVPMHLHGYVKAYDEPEPSILSGFAPFPESNAGFETGSYHNYSPHPNRSSNSSASTSPKRKPQRKPPSGVPVSPPVESIPYSADSIGLDLNSPLPVPKHKVHVADPDALELAPQPTAKMNRDWRMKSGQATAGDLHVDYRTAKTGYTGRGRFSPNVFDRMRNEPPYGNGDDSNDEKPPVPPKVPLGMTEREYYVVDKENFLKDINGRRY